MGGTRRPYDVNPTTKGATYPKDQKGIKVTQEDDLRELGRNIQVPEGPINRAHTKSFQKAFNLLVQDWIIQQIKFEAQEKKKKRIKKAR